MPRTVEFERDAVLESAMQQFWKNGYQATSMRDISACTGLQPGSIYSAFRNKRSIFIDTLERYFKQRLEFIVASFSTDEPALVRFRNFFDLIIKSSLSQDGRKGCLMVNTILEISDNDSEIKGRINEVFQEIELIFKQALDDAKTEGILPKDKDVDGLAKLIITTIHGIRVLNKTRPEKDTLDAIFNSLMSAIER